MAVALQKTTEKFTWDKRRRRAAQLLAENKKSNALIAADVGVTVWAIDNWLRSDVFRNEVKRIESEYAVRLLNRSIASKNNRIEALIDSYEKIEQVIAERAADESMKDVPGGTTGIVVRQWRQVGTGYNAKIVEEFAVDTGTLKEARETMKQVAQEKGEWAERSEIVSTHEVLIREYIGIDVDRFIEGEATRLPNNPTSA